MLGIFKKNLREVFFLSFFVLILYSPIIFFPERLLNRGNDLQEFFYPLIYFVKSQILNNHTFPLWNNLFLSGTPLITDPQSPLFYLPNIIYLIFPLNFGFIFSFILHSLFAGVVIFFLGINIFKFSKISSIFTSILYISSPQIAGFLESGHLGLFNAYCWMPIVLYSAFQLTKEKSYIWSLLLAISSAAIFYSHTIIFSFTIFFLGFFLIYNFFAGHKDKKFLSLYFLSFILISGLIAIAFLPQLEWLPFTTRFQLIDNPQTFPIWNGKSDFLKSLFLSFNGINIQNTSTEKWIVLPVFTLILSIIGFLFLSKKLKIVILLVLILITLIVLNNVSPFYSLFIQLDVFKLLRVTTRVWIIISILVTFLAGFASYKLLMRQGTKKILYLFINLAILEQIFIVWIKLSSPQVIKTAPNSVFEFIKRDTERFRVFCTTRCFSQQKVAQYNFETVEGYNTVVQDNYYRQFLQFSQNFWDYYSLAIPPFGITTYNKIINPDLRALGDYNVKYIISPYELMSTDLALRKKIDNFFIYQNRLSRPRTYFLNEKQEFKGEAKIIKYSPNEIIIDTSNKKTNGIVIAEVYSPGWKAFDEDNKSIMIQEKSDRLRFIDIGGSTNNVTLSYEPESFKLGLTITTITVLVIIFSVLKIAFKKPNSDEKT